MRVDEKGGNSLMESSRDKKTEARSGARRGGENNLLGDPGSESRLGAGTEKEKPRRHQKGRAKTKRASTSITHKHF